MAKQYIVITTVQGRDKNGKKFVINRSADPQEVPPGLVKELLARGAIEGPKSAPGANKLANAAGAGADENDEPDEGSGD